MLNNARKHPEHFFSLCTGGFEFDQSNPFILCVRKCLGDAHMLHQLSETPSYFGKHVKVPPDNGAGR